MASGRIPCGFHHGSPCRALAIGVRRQCRSRHQHRNQRGPNQGLQSISSYDCPLLELIADQLTVPTLSQSVKGSQVGSRADIRARSGDEDALAHEDALVAVSARRGQPGPVSGAVRAWIADRHLAELPDRTLGVQHRPGDRRCPRTCRDVAAAPSLPVTATQRPESRCGSSSTVADSSTAGAAVQLVRDLDRRACMSICPTKSEPAPPGHARVRDAAVDVGDR